MQATLEQSERKQNMKTHTLTDAQKAIGLELVSGGYRNYSAKAAQTDLDLLTGKNTYTLDGDTFHGYEIRHTATGRKVVSRQPPRILVILTVELYRTAAA
jgi:hypothetical protein